MNSAMKTSGTCQACFGRFAIRGENMVLHGYERPGLGYTIGKCWGVASKPYELDCEVTKGWREHVVSYVLPSLRKRAEEIANGTEFQFTVRDVTHPKAWVGKNYPTVVVTFKKGEEVTDRSARNFSHSFEGAQKYVLTRVKSDIEHMEGIEKELDRRIANWKYAPEKLVKSERKKPLVHESRGGNQQWAAMCRMSYRSNSNLAVTLNPAEVTCPRCIARRK